MKYIGVRGHRGAGKDLVSYVVGNTIDYIISNHENPPKEEFDGWIDEIIANENIIHENALRNIYFDSFGDVVKTFVSLLVGIDMSKIQDDYYKDHIFINMKTFEWKEYETVSDKMLVDSDSLYNALSKSGDSHAALPAFVISLRNFIMYFGHNVMKTFFGTDVWIKSLRQSNIFENMFDDKSYKIYRDVKMPSEITYIKNVKKGVIINIIRPDSKKKKGKDNLSKDKRFDYLITIPNDVHDIYDDILKICNNIIDKDNG